ncbi:hypothetical protein IAR55_004734 [Kwoniella newhampshirensis]|uniref:DNA repair protein Swi5/Sae3 n=1 Tax=Kwoniella newhampshirensis TaxID=1651941 RepID=A0AAW0YHV9_9TREE
MSQVQPRTVPLTDMPNEQRTSPPTTSSSTSTSSSSSYRFATPSSTSAGATAISKDDRIQSLREEVERLRGQLGDKDPHKIVQRHIELLHTYNEIKDGTQALIGKYALITNRTIKEVHEELELPLTD